MPHATTATHTATIARRRGVGWRSRPSRRETCSATMRDVDAAATTSSSARPAMAAPIPPIRSRRPHRCRRARASGARLCVRSRSSRCPGRLRRRRVLRRSFSSRWSSPATVPCGTSLHQPVVPIHEPLRLTLAVVAEQLDVPLAQVVGEHDRIIVDAGRVVVVDGLRVHVLLHRDLIAADVLYVQGERHEDERGPPDVLRDELRALRRPFRDRGTGRLQGGGSLQVVLRRRYRRRARTPNVDPPPAAAAR